MHKGKRIMDDCHVFGLINWDETKVMGLKNQGVRIIPSKDLAV